MKALHTLKIVALAVFLTASFAAPDADAQRKRGEPTELYPDATRKSPTGGYAPRLARQHKTLQEIYTEEGREQETKGEAQEAKGKVDKAEPQSDSLRAAVALAESRATTAQDELRGAVTREQAALKELEALRSAPAAASATPAHDRALLQIADRIEALATKVEQIS